MSAENNYVIPVLLTIPAESYKEAVEAAKKVVEEYLSADAGIGAEVETYFEHDNAGQRVLYLHPEEDPEWDGEDEDEEEDEEEDDS